jgi:hypothetical protein
MSDNRMHLVATAWGPPMRQQRLAEDGFEKHRKKTRQLEQIVPWAELAAASACRERLVYHCWLVPGAESSRQW